jgi:flagellar biogenesis protein FliO
MIRTPLRAALVALLAALGVWHTAGAQSVPPGTVSSSQAQFPQIPLRREVAEDRPATQSAAWAALFLLALGGVGFVIVRRGSVRGKRMGIGWQRPANGPVTLKPSARMALTPQVSLHVVEWHGEELLLGCTSQAVTLLSRRVARTVGTQNEAADGSGSAA